MKGYKIFYKKLKENQTKFIMKNKLRILVSMGFLLVMYLITFKYVMFPIYLEYNNKIESGQDSNSLVQLIKNHFLTPPASAEVKLNFEKKIWTSPVTKVVQKILKNKTGGFFIECGAFNGEWLSNSIELETHFGWEGLLVEADPTYQAQLLKKNRKAWIAPVCLSPEPYPLKITMQRHKEWPAMSNIPNLFYGKREPGDFPIQFQVQCFPLYSILLALNRTEIDYLSLDVEGAEWSIIQNIPFDKIKIKVISVEVSKDVSQWSQYLESKGYRFYQSVREPFVADDVYVHASINVTISKPIEHIIT